MFRSIARVFPMLSVAAMLAMPAAANSPAAKAPAPHDHVAPPHNTTWFDPPPAFVLRSTDGAHALTLKGMGQMRLTGTWTPEDGPATWTPRVRRLRTIAKAKLYGGALVVNTHLSLAPRAAEVIDLVADWRVWPAGTGPGLTVRVGQSKVPFTRYRAQSFATQAIADWAPATRAFGAERQWGAAVHTGQAPGAAWSAHLGLYQGQNARAAHAVGLRKDVYKRNTTNASSFAALGHLEANRWPELVGHVSAQHPAFSWKTVSDLKGGDLRWGFALSGAYDHSATRANDWAWRVAPELAAKWHGVALWATGYAAGAPLLSGEAPLGALGGFAQLTYRVFGPLELALSVSHVQYQDALLVDAAPTFADPDMLVQDQHVTGGFNIDVARAAVRIQLDATAHTQTTRRATGPHAATTYQARGQLQFAL